MAEDVVKVVAGYQPAWNNLLTQGPQAIREHLVTAHHFAANEVSQMNDVQCWEAHDRCHEQALGGTLIAG